ncbi:glycosyltransferase family 4 protein [Archangium violaceum]|uniref:glycosyltransferase family 4 protein n=1 Tax=Archangium violaceum TaxID=83451 RepID=UPI0019502CF3|nr:glycosyltransferase family 4 protein [Archangium violaceum]QRN95958.1 glycosyltransferase family 4 protein [Archangium violaceum]
MRLLFLSPVGVVGGAERTLLDLMDCLRRASDAPWLGLIAGAEGPLTEQARALGVETLALPLPSELAALGDSQLRGAGADRFLRFGASLARATPAAAGHLLSLQRALRQLRPTLVHSNGLKTHLLAALCAPGAPVVWHIHDFLGERPLLRRVLRVAGTRAAAAIANSAAVAEDARRVLGPVPVHPVHNGVDTERFAPGPAEGGRLDTLAGLPPAPEGTVRLGLVATYARWKGQEVFLQAAARLRARLPAHAVRFYVVGSPVYRTPGSQYSEAELRATAHALGLEGHVGLIPFQAEPSAIYRALDGVVHASTRPEPFGMTIVEAMSCARAVVVSSAGGAAELVRPGHDALAFSPGDVEGLTEAMARLVREPELRARLGGEARRSVLVRFTRERYASQVRDVYTRVLGGRE